MALSWNEIKDRAVAFSKEWEGTYSEEADAKPFLVEFFNVFGLNQRKVAAFEHKVKKLGDNDGYIDMLWKGWLLIEMKSKGKDLTKAYGQAKGYIHGLKPLDIPKYVLVCDFETFRLYDLEENEHDEFVEFKLSELVNHVELFGFIAGYQKKVYREEDPVNVKAAELMGKLHDRLKEIGYEGHPLEVYLVRLLFCLFAEDTSIFNKQQFEDFIESIETDLPIEIKIGSHKWCEEECAKSLGFKDSEEMRDPEKVKEYRHKKNDEFAREQGYEDWEDLLNKSKWTKK